MDLYFDPFNSPNKSKLVSYTLVAAVLVLVVVFVIMIFSDGPRAIAPKQPAILQQPTTQK